MAKIKFTPLIEEGSGRMGKVVLSSWKGRPFMKAYAGRNDSKTTAQLEVRSTFLAMTRNWKSLAGVLKTAWESYVVGKCMTGLNAFVKTNFALHKEGKALELCKGTGEAPLSNFRTEPGTNPGEIKVAFNPVNGSRHVTFFVQKKEDYVTGGRIDRFDGGENLQSPYIINGLETGIDYFVYAVVSDKAIDEAEEMSASVGSVAKAR